MNKKVELLAPAGDWDAFAAAVENGADAVYMGGKLFNARQFAGNFDDDQLKKAIDYAHVRDVKIYLTMNTLMSDGELGQALDFVSGAYQAGIDGIIVQDLGFAGLIRDMLPDLPLHASTQMTIYNLQGVRMLEKIGFCRVVLARELSLEEIAYISKNTTLEIETFIHGAMCISYSGQCLMSSIIGGRSGNRGKCAQPCRLPYELYTEGKHIEAKGKYLLSPKDMCSIYDMKEMLAAGVRSFKIEGRMKNPEYVATVVRIYRKYIDNVIDNINTYNVAEEDIKALTQVFNRGGLSRGYLKGKTGKDMMCYEKPKNWGIFLGEVISYDRDGKTVKIRLEEPLSLGDGIEVWNGENESPGTVVSEIRVNNVNKAAAGKGEVIVAGSLRGRIAKGNKVYKTSEKDLLIRARESYSGRSTRKINLSANITVKRGQSIILSISDGNNKISTRGNKEAEEAINKPLTEERLAEQIKKTGQSPFEFTKIRVDLEEGLSLPISEINDIRRKALDEIERVRAAAYARSKPDGMESAAEKILYFMESSRKVSENIKVSVRFNSVPESFDFSRLSVDRIYLPFSWMKGKSLEQMVQALHSNSCELFVWLPSVTRGNYDRLIESKLKSIISNGVDGISAGNPGTIENVKKHGRVRIMGDYPLNVFNSLTMRELEKIGLEGATISPELNLGQISGLGAMETFDKEVLVYGRIALMTSEYCPVGSTAGGFGKAEKCSMACEKGCYKLKDRMGVEFPVVCDKIDCRSIILNSNVLFAIDSLDRIRNSGIDMIRLDISDEEPEEIYEIVEMHKDVLANGAGAINRYDERVRKIKDKGFTKGHFFRGV